MTQEEVAAKAKELLEKYLALPDEEKIRRLIAKGTINERGEVLRGFEEPRGQETPERTQAGPSNGAAPSPPTEGV